MLVEADVDGITDTPLASWLTHHGHIVKLPLSRQKRLTAYETFRILDLDGSGRMDVDELQYAFKGLGVNLNKKEVARLVKNVDWSGDLSVGPEEFLQLLHHNQQLFGNTISIQMLAAAHRRQENMSKLLNRKPNQHIPDHEFKLPPLQGLPKRRFAKIEPKSDELLLENQFLQLMRRDSLDDLLDYAPDVDDASNGKDTPGGGGGVKGSRHHIPA